MCGKTRRRAKDYGNPFSTHDPLHSGSVHYQEARYRMWSTTGQRKEKGSAYCFGQQYEMKVVQTLARDLPWNFHVCLVLPIIFKPSNSSSPPEYNLQKNSLVPRRPVRLSCIRGVRFSHLFVRKRQHGSRGYAIVY